METPSSTKMVVATSQQSHESARSRTAALLDITNDSPIVGLASEKTPLSSAVKKRVYAKRTPGSGEALLRGQVKNLLQKVEEEAEPVNKMPFGPHPPPIKAMLGLQVSPAALLAPTPANTPLIPANFRDDVLMVMDGNPKFVEELKKNEEKLGPCLLNRALLFDSPGKSDSSTISYQGSEIGSCREDDNSSVWSLQVNTSNQEECEDGVDGGYYEDWYDDICSGLMGMTVEEEKKKPKLPEFTGKHSRFVYGSNGEIEGEEEVVEEEAVSVSVSVSSPNVMVLKGLPVPEGKHLRFQEEEEE